MNQSFFPHSLGHVFEDDLVLALFGDRRSTPDALATVFSDRRLITLKQTHSDIVVESPWHEPGVVPEADAHVTREAGVALCVRTADCVPVLLNEPESGWIAAIHAGWRGVENEIVLKTGRFLEDRGARLHRARAWVGPHIGLASFEVGRDVGEQLERRFLSVSAFSPLNTSLVAHEDPAKTRVDLLSIVKAQLGSLGLAAQKVSSLAIDTVTSSGHESYRRDRDRAGRQTSFIVLK